MKTERENQASPMQNKVLEQDNLNATGSTQWLSYLIMVIILIIVGACDNDKDESKKVEQFHQDISNVVESITLFVEKAVVYESAQFQTMTPEQVEVIFEEYLVAGEAFVENIQKVVSDSHGTKSSPHNPIPDCVMAVSGFFDVAGISPGMIKDIADLIKETRDTITALNQARAMQIIDDNQYLALSSQLKIDKSIDGVGIGFSAIMATGAGLFTTLACGAAGVATAPALVTVAVVGGTVGYGTYRLWTYYRGKNKSDPPFYMSAVSGTLGEPIPATLFDDGARMIIAIDGYAPVMIESFPYPNLGHNMTVEIDAARLNLFTGDPGGSLLLKSSQTMVEVCYFQELSTGTDCELIAFVSGSANPPNPAPGQSVIVTGSIMPVTPDCALHFSIVGTDGYSNSATHTTDENGQATFWIPGAKPGVVDKVTITAANGASYMVTYVFSGTKEGETFAERYRK